MPLGDINFSKMRIGNQTKGFFFQSSQTNAVAITSPDIHMTPECFPKAMHSQIANQ